MEYSYKFRVYPTAAQARQIQRTFGCCRFVWNHYLALRKDLYEQDGKTMNYSTCSEDMTQLKKTLPWLREVDATALQSSLRDLDTAYQNFFRRVKQGQKPGYPKFKSKHHSKKSYKSKCVGTNIKVLDKAVQLPKLGFVKCRISKDVKGRILSATVSQNPSGEYFVAREIFAGFLPIFNTNHRMRATRLELASRHPANCGTQFAGTLPHL